MLRIALAATLLLAALAVPIPDVGQTPAETQACRHDYERLARLCRLTPASWRLTIALCLKLHRASLRPACRKVLEDHGL